MSKSNRRQFLKTGSMLLPAMVIAPTIQGSSYFTGQSIKLGIASYSFRNFSLRETIDMTKTLGVNYLALKSMHLPLDSDADFLSNARKEIENEGLVLYGCGVVYMKSKDEVSNAFRYAKAAGIETIIGVPAHNLLDLVEEKIKETNIRVAIHNHGPGDDQYPSPQSIYEKIKNRDSRLGICMDIGHTARLGLDPSAEAEKYFDRLLDIHLKDVNKASEQGETVEIGRGIIDIPEFMGTLIKNEYKYIASFEFEKDPDNLMPGISESIGYVKGVLDSVSRK